MKLKLVLFLSLMVFGLEAFSLQISLNNPPADYRVFSLRGSSLGGLTYAGHFDDFSFDVPEEYIVRRSDGSADVLKSLKNWRRSTPIADGNPRTRNGIGYYPFKDSNGNNRYIALEHIYENRPNVVQIENTQELVINISHSTDPSEVSAGETVSDVTSNQGRFDPSNLARQVEADSQDRRIEISQESADNELARSLRPVARPAGLAAVPGIFTDDFPPREAEFSTSRNTANSYVNSQWASMSYTQKAEYMAEHYDELLRAHGFRGTFDPEVLVCKSYKESTFNPQIRTDSPTSTASGVSQVTRLTAADLFSRGKWFRSKVSGFTNIQNGRTFHERMAGSMLAQMELGMAILEQKRRDNNLSTSSGNIDMILRRYYGATKRVNGRRVEDVEANASYARSILDCAECVRSSGYSKHCLDEVY